MKMADFILQTRTCLPCNSLNQSRIRNIVFSTFGSENSTGFVFWILMKSNHDCTLLNWKYWKNWQQFYRKRTNVEITLVPGSKLTEENVRKVCKNVRLRNNLAMKKKWNSWKFDFVYVLEKLKVAGNRVIRMKILWRQFVLFLAFFENICDFEN